MRQIVALDEFHHEGGHALAFFKAMDGRNVRVVQRREDFGFALKTGQSVRIPRQGRWKDLDGDLTLQPGVRRPIDLPHAAFAKLRGHFVDADASALGEGQGCGLYGRLKRPASEPFLPESGHVAPRPIGDDRNYLGTISALLCPGPGIRARCESGR